MGKTGQLRNVLNTKFFADGRQIDSASYSPKENEKISVRGYGRFIYIGEVSLSRKGKKNVAVDLYV